MTTPKVLKVENLANILNITFDDGSVRYLKSNWAEELTDIFTPGKKKKAGAILGMSANMWLGAKYEVDADGNVTTNGATCTSEELWNNSKAHVDQLQ